MGRVWAARRQGAPTQSLVALKTAIEEMVGDREFERILLDEARIASSIVHPNVCAIRELGAERGIPYLVMEWVDAGTLLDVISACPEHRIDIFVAIRIIAEVAAGLHAAHELTGPDGNLLHVVHRDVSPQNVLLSSKGHVKVADFGVARARGQLHKPTETGELKGKLSYMAPEQLTSKIFDRRADVFALGCCLYEATTGHRPFHGGDALETMYKLLETECIKPSVHVTDYPKELEQVVLMALEKDADKRYQTAEELRTALEAILARNGRLVTDREVSQLVKSTLQPVLDARAKALAEANQAILQRQSEPEESEVAQPVAEAVLYSSTGKTPRVWNTDPPHVLRTNRGKIMLGAGAAVTVLIAMLVWPRAQKPAATAATAADNSTAISAPSAAAVSITLRSDPQGAQIRIDDGPTSLSPVSFEAKPSAQLHRITAQLAGYEAQHREVAFEHNQDIILGLKPLVVDTVTITATGSKPNNSTTKRSNNQATPASTTSPRRPRRPLDPSNPFVDP